MPSLYATPRRISSSDNRSPTVGLATNLQSGGRSSLLVELCQHLMSQTRRWLEITFSQSESPMPFESAVLLYQVCWQMKGSSTSPRLRPDLGMALGCVTLRLRPDLGMVVVGACRSWLIMKFFMNNAIEIILYGIYSIKNYHYSIINRIIIFRLKLYTHGSST